MRFVLGGIEYDVDVKETKAMYDNLPYAYQRCTCAGCRNFDARVSGGDNSAFIAFSGLGIDPEKPTNLWGYLPGDEPGTQRYLCTYPIAIVSGEPMEDWERVNEDVLATVVKEGADWVINVDWCLEWVIEQ